MLVSPTTPTTAFPLGERVDDPLAMYLADLCTIPSNLAGNAGDVAARAGSRPRTACRSACRSWRRRWPTTGSTGSAARVEAALADRWGHLLIEEAPDLRSHDHGGSL